MPSALIIAYYFPPVGGAGAQRPAKWCKYLPECGWEVCVVAPDASHTGSVWGPTDDTLNDTLSFARVERVSAGIDDIDHERRTSIAKHQAWLRAASDRVAALLSRERFDAVLITMSPFCLAHVALWLKAHFDVPVILDLRDPWALDGWPTYRTWFEWRRDYALMRRTLGAVDGVIANTPEALKALRCEFPMVDAARWTVIPNGYDEEDFRYVGASSGDPAHLTIVHAGSLHSSELYPPRGFVARTKRRIRYRPEPIQPEGRTLKFLLEALRRLRDAGYPGAERVRVRCVGVVVGATVRCVQESGVGEQVELIGYRPHRESVAQLMAADALFLPLHGYTDPARRALIVPGKTYEYLASGKPILACLPEGDARDLVERSGRGYLALPTHPGMVGAALSQLISDWLAGRLKGGGPPAWLHDYERCELTRRLSAFLTKVANLPLNRSVKSADHTAAPMNKGRSNPKDRCAAC